MWLDQVEQLTAAGIVNGSFYALLGVGFGLILGVTGRFHYAYALTFTLAAYVTSALESDTGVGWPVAVIAGLGAAMLLGVAIERWVYQPLAHFSGALALLTIFISSLGITIAGVNVITLVWTAFSRSITLIPDFPVQIGGATVTTVALLLAVLAWVSIAALSAVMAFTELGRSIKAVRGNPILAEIMGLDSSRVYLTVFAIGSLLCGIAGILDGARYAVQPAMGDRPVVIAFVVAFLGGTQSRPFIVGLAGLFIGLIESLSGLWVSPQWSSLVVFSVLFIYLVLHPVEMRGLRQRVIAFMRPATR